MLAATPIYMSIITAKTQPTLPQKQPVFQGIRYQKPSKRLSRFNVKRYTRTKTLSYFLIYNIRLICRILNFPMRNLNPSTCLLFKSISIS